MIDRVTRAAWARSDFCSNADDAIAILIPNERWGDLPLGYICAWRRICQVAFKRRVQVKQKQLWSALCTYRGEDHGVLRTPCRVYLDERDTHANAPLDRAGDPETTSAQLIRQNTRANEKPSQAAC